MSEGYASLLSSYKESHISFSLRTVLLRGEKGTVPSSAKESVIPNVLPVLISTAILQLALPKKVSAVNWLCSSNGVNFLLNPFIFVNTQIREKFNCIISTLAKVVYTVYRPSITT